MNSRLPIIVWLIFLFSICQDGQAQINRQQRFDRRQALQKRRQEIEDSLSNRRGPYNIVLTAGGGLSYYSTHLKVPAALEQSHISRWGVPASLRAMWYPDHRLRIGLESGWTTMYSYRGTVAGENAKVYVSVVPVLLVFSMPLAWISGTERSLTRRLSVTVGSGIYVNHSRLDYGGTVLTNENSPGWMAAASYTYPIGRRFRVAGELKWYDAVAAENAAFTAEVQLVWRAFSW